MNKVKELGQVFTPKNIVDQMYGLTINKGRLLEPSCGHGAFFDYKSSFKDKVAIELDSDICPSYALNMDFFDYDPSEKFDLIIGNPPYVGYSNISPETKEKFSKNSLVDGRGNLCWKFIEKCYHHLTDQGEIIFIVPLELFKATSALKLNNLLATTGAFSHIIHMGEKAFPGFSPNTVIFRYQKGVKQGKVLVNNINKNIQNLSGQLIFVQDSYTIPFTDYFYVKVGGASGADKIFEHEKGNLDFVVSSTATTGTTKRMFYNTPHPYLEDYKEQLLARRVKSFNENNWYEWGRKFFNSEDKRVYVNVKTRNSNRFFYHPCKNYSGSILGIFIKDATTDPELVAELLNAVDWKELGFFSEGRYSFTQRSLESGMLPDYFCL